MHVRVLLLVFFAAIAAAPAWASITVSTDSPRDAVELFSLTGSDASTAESGVITMLMSGNDRALHWNMRVIVQALTNADAVAVYRFQLAQDAEIRLTSTQNPFLALENLDLQLQVGSGAPLVIDYVDGVFAEIDAVTVSANEFVTITAQWASVSGSFEEVYVDFVLTANAPPSPEALSVAVEGSGRVTSKPPGIDCPGDCVESYRPGTSVALTATPGVGQQFFEWLGACGGSDACTVMMDGTRTVTARFEPATVPDLQPSTTRLVFGEVPIGQSSPVQLLLIENAGDAPLTIGTLSVEGGRPSEYLFSPGNCALQTLVAGQTCSIGVVFAPQLEGARISRLRIESNDPDGPVFVDLLGGDDVVFFNSFE